MREGSPPQKDLRLQGFGEHVLGGAGNFRRVERGKVAAVMRFPEREGKLPREHPPD